jgi:Protein of unknown function (DUF2380)
MREIRLSSLAAIVAAAAVLTHFPDQRAAAAEPIKIAVFEVELNDVSGGSGIVAQDALDTEYLKKATEEARRLLAASGRYSIVDTGDGAEIPRRGIQNCNGCEAAMANKLGADQSMAGVVTRVSRIVYTLQIVIRDAKTGALVSNSFSGGRMGANYAWPHGVKWLMDNQVLSAQRADPSSK